MKRTLLPVLLILIGLVPLVSSQEAGVEASGPQIRMAPWPEEVLDAVSLIPIQEGGRIKPLSSMAGFMMLSINRKQSYTTHWGEKLGPVEWFLDCVFFPEQAMDYRVIDVVDYRIIESVGLKRRTTKRADHYSMREILPASEQLQIQRNAFLNKHPDERTILESQIINLGRNLKRLIFTTSFLDFVRAEFELSSIPEFESAYPDDSYISTFEFVTSWLEIKKQIDASGVLASPGINASLGQAQRELEAAGFYRFIPPADLAQETYYSPGEVIERVTFGDEQLPSEMALVRGMLKLGAQPVDMEAVGAGLIALQQDLQALAETRNEFAKVSEEVTYYKRDWFFRSQLAFWLAFLCCLVSWFFPKKSLLKRLSYGSGVSLVLLGEGLVVSGIVARCLLKDRPPVTTVYEAILFIFAAIVLMSLFIELIKRNSLALTLAALVGGAGMYVGSWNLETEATDTISPLVAVLNTNFWLSIHVPTITLGYAAGMLAAVFGHVFILAKLWDVIRRNAGVPGVSKAFFKDLTKMTYGVLCFGALTATVGTILGGVWANDSWGRFWGWDPKENGALLLCLGYLAILHGRMGGYLRQFGIALSSIALGTVVLWAFWGVNLLQIGFHSYGFDATKAKITNIYYWTEWSVVVFGLLIWGLDRMIPKVKMAK